MEPTCYVVVAGKRENQRLYGPFQTEEDGWHWVNRYLPSGSIFQVLPVYGSLNP